MTSCVKAISQAVKKQKIELEDLAKATEIDEKKLTNFLAGKKDVSLEELTRIVKYLDLDLNEVMGIHVKNDPKQYIIKDEMEQRVNQIARSIRAKDRKKFERAVEYLAECFDEKWRGK